MRSATKFLEKHIEAKVVRYCKARGLYCRKFTSPAHRGAPDRIIIGKGKVMFLELKRPGNTPTALQHHELTTLCSYGVIALWTDCFEQAKRMIDNVFERVHDCA